MEKNENKRGHGCYFMIYIHTPVLTAMEIKSY